MPSKPECQTSKRGRGRPKGAKNKLTVEREKIRNELRTGTLEGRTDTREILFEVANRFWNHARYLDQHAIGLKNEGATREQIEAAMIEADKQAELASKCAYLHARIANGVTDGAAATSFVVRLPEPCATSEQWAAECAPQRWHRQNGSH